MTEITSSFERATGNAPPFILGKCSACGGKAQRRMNAETWYHVDVYDEWGVHRHVTCPKGPAVGRFVQEKTSRRRNATSVEPHYREITEQIMDYDNVDADGKPAPMLKNITRPILCTCTSESCPGWGVPLPPEIKKFREEN